MKKILLFLFTSAWLSAFSQSDYSLPPCGTPAALQDVQFGDLDFSRSGGDTVLYVPMTIFQLSNDNGAAAMPTNRLLDNLTRLNLDYASANIQFYMEGDIRFIKNSAYNNHKDIPTGANMMFKNNIANTINVYFGTSAAGNCGYNLPYAGVSMAKSCSGGDSHTWTHELGHALRLPHPFLGWEGKTYSPNVPTPTKVTYDYTLFKDSIILNQTIIDTALVELVDKSNCAKAADQICDTKADYYAFRWNCDAAKESPATLKDPTGASFKIDGSLYMSYSFDACQNRFSPDEIAVMRTVLKGKKKNLLYNQTPKSALATTPQVLTLPADKGFSAPDNTLLKWEKTNEATDYVVEISRLSSFSSLDVEVLTKKTEVLVTNLAPNKLYYWRVRPFNSHFAGVISAKQTFTTNVVSAVKNLDKINDFVAYPNPIDQNELTLRINANTDFLAKIQVNDFMGRIIFEKNIPLNQNEENIQIAAQNWAKGIYFVSITDEKGSVMSRKVVK